MRKEEYLAEPCRASSLPFWKTEQFSVPRDIKVVREDLFDGDLRAYTDEPYFKMIRPLKGISRPELPAPFRIIQCGTDDFARHIRECYTEEGATEEELRACSLRPVYDPELWIAVGDATNQRIAATGIADVDTGIREGILEWIQVSPDYRHKGLGRFLVLELLYRMQGKADFATVSGRMRNPENPYALYRACGFTAPVIWHVIRARAPENA